MTTRLFENGFCEIVDINGQWVRIDKILGTKMNVDSYWKNNVLIKNI